MSNDDDKYDKIKTRWDCTKGLSWERAKRTVRVELSSEYGHQDDFSLWDAATGADPNGDAAGAPVIPVGAGQAQAQAKRNKRQSQLWAALAKVPTDEVMRNMILNLPPGDLAAAGGGVQGIGRRAWILLDQEGTAPFDDEYVLRILSQFTLATIIDTVGYNEGSIQAFNRYLSNLVFLVPAAQQPTENGYCIKLLECIGKEAPDALAHEATKELKAVPAARVYVHPGGGGANRHRQNLVK